MVRSMTAYARHDIKATWGSAAWELRSINSRYLEIHIRLPEQFRSLEPIIREQIRPRLTRGKLECNLYFEPTIHAQNSLMLNKNLAKQLIEAGKWVKMQSDEGEINPLEILSWPGVIAAEEQDLDMMSNELMQALNITVEDFILSRETEGSALSALIRGRLDAVQGEITKVRLHMPHIIRWQRERLLGKLADAEVQCDEIRLEQELLLMAQRIDVAEEVDRLEAHVKEAYNVLQKKEAVGRRLDFMMQELNREANTLASKSINVDITNCAIELKVLIEQMREQIQNIE